MIWKLFDFFNYIAPILTFLTTFVLAGITLWYAVETRKIANKTKEQVEIYEKQLDLYEKQISMTYSPFVINYGELEQYDLNTQDNYSFGIRLFNAGNSSAINIACESSITIEGKQYQSITSPRVHKLDSKEITNIKKNELLMFSYGILTKDVIDKNKIDISISFYYSSIVSIFFKTTIFGKLLFKKTSDKAISVTMIPIKYKNDRITEEEYLLELNKEGEISF